MEPVTRKQSIIAGKEIPPRTREEQILAGQEVAPRSRNEYFLEELAGGTEPTGSTYLTTNGEHDVAEYATAIVAVPSIYDTSFTIQNNTSEKLYFQYVNGFGHNEIYMGHPVDAGASGSLYSVAAIGDGNQGGEATGRVSYIQVAKKNGVNYEAVTNLAVASDNSETVQLFAGGTGAGNLIAVWGHTAGTAPSGKLTFTTT